MNSMSEPPVTVITPVFNTDAYLAQCIEGILSQKYATFNYIIVNNCSTDRSLEIANKYAKLDSRIHIVNNKHFLDQISNFNYAASLLPPKAKYCKFAFADDVLLPTCLEQMVQIAESDPDISVVSCYVSNSLSVWSKGIPFGKNIISGREACRLYLLKGCSPFNSFNGLLFRAAEIRQRNPFQTHNDGFFEDADVCFDILKHSKLGFVHQILAFNRRDNASTLSKIEWYNPLLITDLLFLFRYGNYYLSQGEFERRWNKKLREYLKFLGKSVLTRQDKAFWEFHNRGMEQMGFVFNKRVMVWNVLLILLDYALNPKSSAEKLFARLAKRRRDSVALSSLADMND
jgi:glycosyltransferase involved in cell wall biosynthesis